MRAIIVIRLEKGPILRGHKGRRKITMSGKRSSKFERLRAFIAGFLVFIGIFTGVGSTILQANNVYATSDNDETVLTTSNDDESDDNSDTEETDGNTDSTDDS